MLTKTHVPSGPAPKPIVRIEDFGNGIVIYWKI